VKRLATVVAAALALTFVWLGPASVAGAWPTPGPLVIAKTHDAPHTSIEHNGPIAKLGPPGSKEYSVSSLAFDRSWQVTNVGLQLTTAIPMGGS